MKSKLAAKPSKREACAEANGALAGDYEAPRVTKKRSVSRVTLFSGGGPMAGGLVATGG